LIVIGHKDGSIEKSFSSGLIDQTQGTNIHTVIGGEFVVGNDEDNVAFKTLLGSCVAIMFYDKVKKIKAMNHFLLPSTNDSRNDMKYGLYSVEAMLNEMYKLGCSKQNMTAKISGGADIMHMQLDISSDSIGKRNVEFAQNFCKSEGFRIVGEHVRGQHGRLILLVDGFETFIKVTQKSETDNKILSTEKSLQQEIKKEPVIKEYVGGVELFDSKKRVEPKMEIDLF
jgi:chemotaxis protein CheD